MPLCVHVDRLSSRHCQQDPHSCEDPCIVCLDVEEHA